MPRATLYRSMVEDRVETIAQDEGVDTHVAFLMLIFHLETGLSYGDLEPEDFVDGAGEYQIDLLYIDDSIENQATAVVIQATYGESLSSTRLLRLHAGLDYLLQRPRAEYSSLMNGALADRIQHFREVRARVSPRNTSVQCFYANLLDPEVSPLESEFNEQVSRIRSDYQGGGGEFIFEPLGPRQIVDLINRHERSGADVTSRLRIIYDQNKANILEHSAGGVNGIICTATAEEIARIVEENPDVFEENLRRFRGFGAAVNKGIRNTCTTLERAPLFWFLNNGITIVCDDFDPNKDYDDPYVEIKNPRIVNGCQTSATIAKAHEAGTLQAATKVMVRILRADTKDLASDLVITTNNQNKITSRELHARDPIQYAIQQAFEQKFEIWYERTPNEFAHIPRRERRPVISNQRIGQAYLALVEKHPGDARGRVYRMWDQEYEHVFSESILPEAYLLAYRLVERCKVLKRENVAQIPDTDPKRPLLAYGVLHLARIIAFVWRRGDDWRDEARLKEQLQLLTDQPDIITDHFDRALEILGQVLQRNEQLAQDPSMALKSPRLDDEIDRELYAQGATTG